MIIFKINTAEFSGYYFYMKTNIKRDLQFYISVPLKVVSATFLLVSFVCLKESSCKTRKNAFYFTSKALLVLEIINFLHVRYSNVMTSSNAQAWNTKHILLNNSGSKHSLVMKSGQFLQYHKIIFLSKNSTKNLAWELVPGPL